MQKYEVGIDEVGRGAWAGPVVAAAVVLAPNTVPDGVRDSKQMTPAARARANRRIRAQAKAVGIGWVTAAEVDANGLSWAVRTSGLRALESLAGAGLAAPQLEVVLDGAHNYLAGTGYASRAIVKADATVPCVSAASVVAKVARDNYLACLSRRYPGYGLAGHKGYGTAAHQAALRALGPSPEHRRSYAPIQRLLAEASGPKAGLSS